jgi:hypothetical protein
VGFAHKLIAPNNNGRPKHKTQNNRSNVNPNGAYSTRHNHVFGGKNTGEWSGAFYVDVAEAANATSSNGGFEYDDPRGSLWPVRFLFVWVCLKNMVWLKPA